MMSNHPIKITGLTTDTDQELAEKVETKLTEAAMATFGHLNHATIGFRREGHSIRCVINLQVANLRIMVADADAHDGEGAFVMAITKIEKQLRRRMPAAAAKATEPTAVPLAA